MQRQSWLCGVGVLVVILGLAWTMTYGQATGAGGKFQTVSLTKAQADFTAAMSLARRTLTQALDGALKSAMRSGDLAEANAINGALKSLQAGSEPAVEFKSPGALRAKADYDAAAGRARGQYVTILQGAQKAVLAAGNLAEANAIQAEIGAVTGTASAPGKDAANESGDLVISGKGFTMATLDNNVPAFGNRGYVWQKVPASVRGSRYTKTNGGTRAEIKVRAKRETVVQVATDLTDPGVKMSGWDRTGISFTYNNGKGADVTVFKKKLAAGEEVEIPQGNWGGVLVLLPAE